MKITRQTAPDAVAAVVCDAFLRRGIETTLTGGTVVSIYTGPWYVSQDIDFVCAGLSTDIAAVMRGLGFELEAGRHWRHPANPFIVEFPPGPLAVGDALVTEIAERTINGLRLRLLTPTDCVRDRLSAWFHWKDEKSFAQALAVADRNPVEWTVIERWAATERATKKFQEFRKAARKRKKR